jgi:hypothetical protein
MNWMRLVFLTIVVALCAPAADLTGTWKAVFLGPQDHWPKTVGEMTFELKSTDATVTGKAHVGSWPGDTEISDGKIEGNRISFTVLGNSPWKSRGPQGEASGYPRLRFTGTVEGDQMKLSLVWDSIMAYGADGAPHTWEMTGKKIPDAR